MRTHLSASLLLAACTAPITPDARYVGTLTPTSPSGLCKASRAVLRLRDGQALFIPDETTWSLTGIATADGALNAERTTQDANRRSYVTRLAGTWTRTAVTGDYITPRCTYTVSLDRG